MRPNVGVGIMIKKDEKILMGLRNPNKNKGSSELKGEGTWSMPGGKVDFGETLEEAIIRETKEETDLDIKKVKVAVVQDDITETAHYVTIEFIAEEYEGEVKVMEPNDMLEWKWFDINDLPENLYPATKQFLDKYKQGILY